ncbi:MAG: hypothetical protein WAL75_23805 [Terracidiphilus sp.]
MENPMKILAAAFCALNIAMLSPSALHPQQESQRSEFRVEISPAGQGRPACTVTNLSGKPVWALVLEISSSSQPARKAKKVWDMLLDGLHPIEPGASTSRGLFEFAFSPTPDRIKVIAAVWTDGETFGAPASVNLILNTRAARAAEYEDAAGILQRGLNQNWTRDQYEQAFRDKPDSGAVYTVRTAISASQQTAPTPQAFTQIMQFLLTRFQQLSKQLRQVKPI